MDFIVLTTKHGVSGVTQKRAHVHGTSRLGLAIAETLADQQRRVVEDDDSRMRFYLVEYRAHLTEIDGILPIMITMLQAYDKGHVRSS